MEDAVETIQLAGFDPAGEPQIRRTATGRLWLCIRFMPPMWADESERTELGRWADFDRQMAKAIGVPVIWDDREWFYIEHPREDTVAEIQRFLIDVRRRFDVTSS